MSMDETCFELQCLRFTSALPKPPTDSDDEGDSEPSPNCSEFISHFYALRDCPHPRLAALLKLTPLRRNRIAVVTESYPRTLADLIQERRATETPFREEEVLRVCFELIQAVAHLHQHGVAVLNLCPANVVVAPEVRRTQGCFILKNYYEAWLYGSDYLFTRDWKFMAPEETSGTIEYRYKVDTWAIAMIAIQCFTLASLEDYDMDQEYPQLLSLYKSRPLFQTHRPSLKSKVELLISGRDWSESLSEEFQSFLTVSLSLAPASRLDPIDLLGHPVFTACRLAPRQTLNLEELYYWWLRLNNITNDEDLERYLIFTQTLPFVPPVLAIPALFDPEKTEEKRDNWDFLGRKMLPLEQLL